VRCRGELTAKSQDRSLSEESDQGHFIVDLLAANPFLTATGIAGELGIVFTTAQRAIDRLERRGIVKRTTDAKRDRVSCAQTLLDILEGPANLTGAPPE
jgi:DNA-binding MarR family transcriptional regulator